MLTYLHNAKCSKSRAALSLIEQSGHAFELRNYLQQPLSAAELTALLGQLGCSARQLLRTGEPEYVELGLANTALPESALIQAMVDQPKLMERPILTNGLRAVIGRPPERVLELL